MRNETCGRRRASSRKKSKPYFPNVAQVARDGTRGTEDFGIIGVPKRRERGQRMAKEKKSFILYVDQGEQVGMLSDSEAGRLFKALFCFAGEGKNAYFGDGMTQMCFSFMSAQITRDQEAYREKCAKLSENAKRRKQLHAIEGDTDTVTDTATVTDTVTETETDTVTVTGTVTGTVSGTDTCLNACACARARERCSLLRRLAPQNAPRKSRG